MTPSNFVLILVATIVVLAVLAKRFSLPYPIVFVVGGGFLAFFPHLPGNGEAARGVENGSGDLRSRTAGSGLGARRALTECERACERGSPESLGDGS